MKKIAMLLIIVGTVGAIITAKSFFAREYITGEEYISSNQIDHIVIDSRIAATVRVLPSESSNIEVKWEGSLFNVRSNMEAVSINEKDSKLTIDIGEMMQRFHFSFHIGFSNSLHVDVYVPEKQFESITVENAVGKTLISSVDTNHLTAESDVAELTIENVRADEIHAESSVGSMNVINSTGKLYVKSDVGSIDIKPNEIADDMTIVSNVGSIKLSVPTIPANVSFIGNSEIGSVKIFGEKGSYINKGAEYVVSMNTDVGSIDVRVQE